MFIFLLGVVSLLFLKGYGTQAVPLGAVGLRDDLLQCSCPNTRSLLDIIWSCIATIFVCTWVSVHPNVSPPGENWFQKTLRRAKLMFWGLIGPELILSWAIRQWISARHITKEYKKHSWTMTHAFFLIMGGFVLYRRGDEDLGTLTVELFKELEAAEEIELPSVTEEDLLDKSKGDFLSKGLVVLQTTWFITQCIARAVHGLGLTELEIMTMAFASMNAVMYYLWWHKPLDVDCRIRIYLKPTSNYVHKNELQRAEEFYIHNNRDAQELEQVLRDEHQASVDQVPSDTHETPLLKSLAICHRQFKFLISNIRRKISHIFYVLQQELRNYNILFLIFVRWPFLLLESFLSPVADLFGSTESEEAKPGRKMVPTFYSPAMTYERSQHLVYIFGFTGTVFGAIHCIPWSFEYPTSVERTIWRVLSVYITSLPLVSAAMQAGGMEERMNGFEVAKTTTVDKLLDWIAVLLLLIFILMLLLYVVARLILLFEAFYLLRDLSPDIYLDINWDTFVPHL